MVFVKDLAFKDVAYSWVGLLQVNVYIHILENSGRVNSKSVKLGKEREELEDKGKDSVTTTKSN